MRPNSVMRGYKPEVVCLCWVAETHDDSYHSGFTWGGLPNLINRVGREIRLLKIVDLRSNLVYEVTDMGQFMDEWADHYADPQWQIDQCSGVKKL